jgi:nucleotide-binding universal stress UspA family protein
MFKHILIPVSRVAEVEKALELAVDMLKNSQADITLLHVIELVQDMPYEEFETFYDELEQQGEADLQIAKERYKQREVEVKTRVMFGQRVKEILSFAERESVDLLLLQSHPIDLTDPAKGWGTISYRVALLAKCPVMLVK